MGGICICVIRVWFYLSLVCTDSKVSRKRLSLRDLVIKTNVASSRGTFSLNSQGQSMMSTQGEDFRQICDLGFCHTDALATCVEAASSFGGTTGMCITHLSAFS